LREGLSHPQIAARNMRIKDSQGSDHLGVPIRFANEPGQPHFELAGLGADGPALLRRAGMSDFEIDALRIAKVLGTP